MFDEQQREAEDKLRQEKLVKKKERDERIRIQTLQQQQELYERIQIQRKIDEQKRKELENLKSIKSNTKS